MYKAGLHIISEFEVKDPESLKDMQLVQTFLNQQVTQFGLHKIGEVFHSFPDSGYTGVICLTESHLSIHTWPEFNRVTFDVFLSNYQQVNDQVAEQLHQNLLNVLTATQIQTTRLKR